MSWERALEERLRNAARRGEFDNLPGAGRPLEGLDEGSAVDAWLQRRVREEGLDLPLPPGLQLRKDVAAELDRIRDLPTERAVRTALAAVNVRIARANARGTVGPAANLAPISIERFVAGWRSR